MKDHRTILSRVGLVLIVLGIGNVALKLYRSAGGPGGTYRVDVLGILAIVAGAFLMRGSLRAARLVTWVTAFTLSAVVGMLLLLAPLLQPFGLLVAEARLDPAQSLVTALLSVAGLVLLVWTYRQLRSAPVLDALVNSSHCCDSRRTSATRGDNRAPTAQNRPHETCRLLEELPTRRGGAHLGHFHLQRPATVP